MVVDRKLVIVMIIILALVAALEARPRLLVMTLSTPPDSPSPLNPGPYGSSILASRLSSREESSVIILPELPDLERARIESDYIALVIIGSDYLEAPVMERTIDLVEDIIYGRLPGVSGRLILVYADERPKEEFLDDLERLQAILCGEARALISPRTLSRNTTAVVHAWSDEILVTGYTSYISKASNPLEPLALWREYPRSGLLEDGIIAVAWPSTQPISLPNMWYPLAYYCEGPLGGVILIADSTLLINLAQNVTEEYLALLANTVELIAGGSSVTYVFVAEHYTSDEFEGSVAAGIHPSILIISLLNTYYSLEPSLVDFITRVMPLFALGLISGMALILLSLVKGYLDEILPSKGKE